MRTRPVDRPNLSKDYLAGTAPEEWIPLRPPCLLRRAGHRPAARHARRRHRSARAARCARRRQRGALRRAAARHRRRAGAPADSRGRAAARAHLAHAGATAARSSPAPGRRGARCVVGASFIGLEVAASLRARGLEVHVVAPEPRRWRRVLGPRARRPRAAGCTRSTASSSTSARRWRAIDAGARDAEGRRRRWRPTWSSLGVGVRPRTALAEAAGLAVDRGVLVDEYLRDQRARASSPPATSRAGPTRTAASASASSTGWWRSGMGQAAALNILGGGSVRRRAVLLEPALRRAQHRLRRPCRAVGHDRHRGRPRREAGACCATAAAVASSPSPRSTGIGMPAHRGGDGGGGRRRLTPACSVAGFIQWHQARRRCIPIRCGPRPGGSVVRGMKLPETLPRRRWRR